VNTFDRHLLREWLNILFLVLVATIGLLTLQVSLDDMRGMLEAGARFREVLHYILVTLPSFFALVLPMAMLISLLFTLSNLHRANELTAMRAAGVGFARMMAPVWVVGLLACGAVWYLNSTLVPWSVENSDRLKASIAYRNQAKSLDRDKVGAVYDVAFEDPATGRMWFFNRYSQAAHLGSGVAVTQREKGRFPSSQILAAQAWAEPAKGGWRFRHGRQLEFDADTGEVTANRPFEEKFMAGYNEDPQLMVLTDRRPEDLSFFELGRLVRYFRVQNPSKVPDYAMGYYSILAATLGPLIVIGIAIPFSVSGVRVNPAIGVLKSMGLFVLYYVLNVVAKTAAARGWLQPEYAAWMPSAALILLAVWFFARLR
jgi:lipopolysaccharide export system permease protein